MYEQEVMGWREAMLATVSRLPAAAPLSLSGGVDSATILAALLTLGRRPDVLSFHVEGHESRDFVIAREMAAANGLRFSPVVLPRSVERLVADLRTMSPALNPPIRKTHVQCSQPVLHLARAARSLGYDEMIVGTGGVVEDNRKCAVVAARDGENAARALRRANLLGRGDNATEAMKRVALLVGVALHEPYSSEPIAEYGLGLNLGLINFPRQKGIAIRAFDSFWSSGRWYRENSPLQVGSGVREWHDAVLLSDARYNGEGFRDVAAVYRRILDDGCEPAPLDAE